MPAHYDLVVGDARLRGRDGRYSVGIDGGHIVAIEEEPLRGRAEIDADGSLVTESFVNAHLHLCKVYTLDRIGDAALTAYTEGSMGAAMTSIELSCTVSGSGSSAAALQIMPVPSARTPSLPYGGWPGWPVGRGWHSSVTRTPARSGCPST